MKKLLILPVIILSLNAKIVDKVVASVENEPITSYDIENVSKNLHIDKNRALNYLIDQKLIESEIKKRGIEIDDFEINQAMEKIAKRNHLSLFEFKDILRQKGELEKFKRELKQNLLKQKLFSQIVDAKLQITPDELKNYYDSHKDEFAIFKTIQVTKYTSNNPQILKKLFNNPFYNDPNIKTKTEVFESDKMPLNMIFLLKNTEVGHFTPVINEGLDYVTYYVANKQGKVFLPFDKVKNVIANKIVSEKRDLILKEYFDRIKNRADIKIYK